MGSVPQQVRRQSERANDLLNSLSAEADNPDTPVPVPQDPPEGDQTVETQDTAVPQDQPPASESTEQTPTPTPEATPEVTPPATPTGEARSNDQDDQRYRTLQGIFATEQQRWSAERQQLQERISALEKRPAEPAPAPAPAPAITDQDVETYGPELIDLIGRRAREMAAEIVSERLSELQPALDQTRDQVTNVATQVHRTNEERFLDALTEAVPDWREVNADQRWLQWLGEKDPLSGIQRQAYLDNASQTFDHARAARMFQAFKQLTGTDPDGVTAPAAAPPKPAISPTPRTVGTATAPAPREPDMTVSSAEISAHYRRGTTDSNYRSSPEYAAMEKRIAAAMASNKITN